MFSVVIPTRDRPELLAAAVASVLGQTVSDLEVVVIDDAGHLAPVLPEDERIRVIRHDANRGPAASRNTGAAAAAGRYLAFLDDDDLWVPQRLELALAGLARAPIAICWSRYADEVPSPKPVLDGDVRDTVLDHTTPMFNATALDREVFEPLDEAYLGTEDVAWWRSIAQRHQVATVPEFGVVVRRHGETRVLHGDRARIEGSLRLLREHADWFSAHPAAAALRWQRIGLTALKVGDLAVARDAFGRSRRARPALRPLVHLARAWIASARVGTSTTRPGPLSILQVITDTDRRGAQVFATDLAVGLDVLGHHVSTVALAPGSNATGLDLPVLGPTRRGPRTLLALRRRMAAADVVVAHGSTTLPACAIASLGLDTPFVYRQISESLFWARTPAARRRVGLLLSRAAVVVSLAADAGDVLVDAFGVGRGRVRVVPNGVPASAFTPATPAARADARHHFGLDPTALVVLAVSALVPEKGVDRVIDAVGSLDGVELLVAGDGPDRVALERRAAAVLGDRAHFVGSVMSAVALYHAADVLVLASRGGDSMPATLIEAGLCGLPTVATPVGAIAAVIDDGRTGLIVPQDDQDRLVAALRSLVTDPVLRATLGRQAIGRCRERFVIDVVAGQWEQALRSAVAVSRRRRLRSGRRGSRRGRRGEPVSGQVAAPPRP